MPSDQTERHAVLRQCLVRTRLVRGRCDDLLCQPEVEHGDVVIVADEDIAWFDVAMDDAFRVRRVEGIGNLERNRECAGGVGGSPGQVLQDVCPSSSSITRNGRPSVSPMS
jgi:hypothetical protein